MHPDKGECDGKHGVGQRIFLGAFFRGTVGLESRAEGEELACSADGGLKGSLKADVLIAAE